MPWVVCMKFTFLDQAASRRLFNAYLVLKSNRCRRWAPSVFAAVAGLLGTVSAHAQADASPPDAPPAGAASVLVPIEVIANAPKNPLVVVTDPKQPRQPLPASDGADYLKTVPGFSAIRSGGTNADTVFRGMSGSRLSLLSNGAPMLGACPGRMDAPTSYIAPESYDKVTVVKGPQSVLYGPGASAGTVLFERTTRRFDAPGMRFDGSLVGGSFGRNDQNVDLSAGVREGYARVMANHAHQQDYRDGNGKTVPSQWDKWNVDTSLGWTPNEHTRIEASAGTGDGYARYAGRGMDGARFRRESYGLRAERSHLGEVLDRVEAQVYYNDFDHVMDNFTLRSPAGGGRSMPMASEVRRRTFGARSAATLRFTDRFKLVAGVDGQHHALDNRSLQRATVNGNGSWKPSATLWSMGGFGELTWYATQSERMVTGLRVDRAAARDRRVNVGSGAMQAPNPTANVQREHTLPSGFVRYEHDLAMLPAMWYIGIGHAERFPDYWELFSPKLGPEGSVNAFSSLRPEKTTQLDIGTQYSDERLDAWVSAYAGSVRDFILFDYVSGPMGPANRATQVGARILGGELGAAWRVTPAWRFETALAYTWGRNNATGGPLPQIPPLEARVGAHYQHGTWSVGALWRVVAAQRRYVPNEGNVVGKDFGPSAGFGVASLHAQYAFGKAATLTLGVDNLFDNAYTEHLNLAGNAGFGYPANSPVMESGRTVWLRLGVKL